MIVDSFVQVRLIELDHPGIARGSRELQIIAKRNFPFPESAWVQNNAEFGINRVPSNLDASWGSLSMGGEGDIVLASMGGGRYLGEPVAKAVLEIREYDHRRRKIVWSHKWELGPLKLQNSKD